MMPGISFNMDGPVMTGTWYNPKNGDSFTVRDTYFEDNNYMVMTTDGRRLDYNFIQNYIKSDTPLPKMEQPKQSPKIEVGDINTVNEGIITSNDELILSDDLLLLQNKTIPQNEFDSVHISSQRVVKDIVKEKRSDNYYIIEKAFSKVKPPKFDIVVKWSDFPTKEIDMLTNIMDVSIDEIKDYIFETCINDSYKEKMKEKLNILTNDNLGIIEEKPKTKPIKKTTKKK